MARENSIQNERLPDEAKFRRYLLGLCPLKESDEVERAILIEGANPILNVIEDELVEDYVTGELSDSDRSRFESRFLFSQQRLEKIRLSAMLLGRPDVAATLSERVTSLRQEPRLWNTERRSQYLGPEPGAVTAGGGKPATRQRHRMQGWLAAAAVLLFAAGGALWLRRESLPHTTGAAVPAAASDSAVLFLLDPSAPDLGAPRGPVASHLVASRGPTASDLGALLGAFGFSVEAGQAPLQIPHPAAPDHGAPRAPLATDHGARLGSSVAGRAPLQIPPLQIPRTTKHLAIVLPVGSKEGNYDLALLSGTGDEVLRFAGTAHLLKDRVYVVMFFYNIDLGSVRPGSYVLGVRQPGLEWTRYPVRVL
jgi:hypothetical protein